MYKRQKFLRMDEKRLKAWKDRKDKRMDYFLEGVRLFQEATGYPVTFHDVLLVAYLIDSRVVTLKKGHFAVELSGRLTRGTMVEDVYKRQSLLAAIPLP